MKPRYKKMMLIGSGVSILVVAGLLVLNAFRSNIVFFSSPSDIFWSPSEVVTGKAVDFIRAKREDGRLRQFNLSVLITDEFMQAVKKDQPWELVFPCNHHEYEDPETRIVWRYWPRTEGYVTNDVGQVACKIYKTLPARRLWDVIMASTYDYAEPGFILIDKINEMNNNWWCENIRATNPCGEQPLPPYGSCLLGSVNLTRFVRRPFTDEASFDWDEYREVVRTFTRMLDNVVEINGLPLGRQRDEITRKRRHGMGFLGLGSTITMLGMKYGSPESIAFTDNVSREMAISGWEAGLELAREPGAEIALALRQRRRQRHAVRRNRAQVRNHADPILLIAQTRERHLGAGDIARRRRQEAIERQIIPTAAVSRHRL